MKSEFIKKENEISRDQLRALYRENKTEQSLEPNSHVKFRIALIGKGTLFGEEDALKRRPCTSEVTCFSQTAKLYKVNSDDFIRQVKFVSESSLKEIMKSTTAKEKQVHSEMMDKIQLHRD